MAKNTEIFPVSKGDSNSFFGYADAGQIARSKGKLKLFDADAAEKIKAEAVIDAEAAKIDEDDRTKAAVKASGGADAGAVKKSPAK